MSTRVLVAPHHCERCGAITSNPRFCGRTCSMRHISQYNRGVPSRGAARPNWKGDSAGVSSKRHRAVRLYELGPCERCGKPGSDRHHIDGNTGNNIRANILICCRHCHMAEDGRMGLLVKAGAAARKARALLPPRPCATCGRTTVPQRNGECHSCNEFRRRNGYGRESAPLCVECGIVVPTLATKHGQLRWCSKPECKRAKQRRLWAQGLRSNGTSTRRMS